jgi:hypothetical protein
MHVGVYLSFFTRPRFGVYGLWCGFSVGMGMLALVLVGIVLTTDWEREVRRTQVRIEKYSQSNAPLSWSGQQSGAGDERGRLAFITQASAIPGARALGIETTNLILPCFVMLECALLFLYMLKYSPLLRMQYGIMPCK